MKSVSHYFYAHGGKQSGNETRESKHALCIAHTYFCFRQLTRLIFPIGAKHVDWKNDTEHKSHIVWVGEVGINTTVPPDV